MHIVFPRGSINLSCWFILLSLLPSDSLKDRREGFWLHLLLLLLVPVSHLTGNKSQIINVLKGPHHPVPPNLPPGQRHPRQTPHWPPCSRPTPTTWKSLPLASFHSVQVWVTSPYSVPVPSPPAPQPSCADLRSVDHFLIDHTTNLCLVDPFCPPPISWNGSSRRTGMCSSSVHCYVHYACMCAWH